MPYIGTNQNDTLSVSSDPTLIGAGGNDSLTGLGGSRDLLIGDNHIVLQVSGTSVSGYGPVLRIYTEIATASGPLEVLAWEQAIKVNSTTPIDVVIPFGFATESVRKLRLVHVVNDAQTQAEVPGTPTLTVHGVTIGNQQINQSNTSSSATPLPIGATTTFAIDPASAGTAPTTGQDTLVGSQNDTLAGGGGNDTYVVTQGSVTIIEAPDQGDDLIELSASIYRLPTHVENLNAKGTQLVQSIEGNELSNIIQDISGLAIASIFDGRQGDDWLVGRAGNDILAGGEDDDALSGGDGDDLLLGDASVEIDPFIGLPYAGWVGRTGSDTLYGGAGRDTLLAGAGNDELTGGADADLLIGGNHIVLRASGTSVDGVAPRVRIYVPIRLPSGQSIEALAAEVDIASPDANPLDFYIPFGYEVEGVQRIRVEMINHVKTASAERAVVIESITVNGYVQTDSDRNTNPSDPSRLVFNGSAIFSFLDDTRFPIPPSGVTALQDQDVLIGGAADTLAGGGGNDTYVINEAGATITEAPDQGIDLVETRLSRFALSEHVDNLVVTANQTDFSQAGATSYRYEGSEVSNFIVLDDIDLTVGGQMTGRSGNDTLWGAAGNDTLWGGNGNDVLDGSVGNDVLVGEASSAEPNGNAEAFEDSGNDTLIGGAGADLLAGGAGNDLLLERHQSGTIIQIRAAQRYAGLKAGEVPAPGRMQIWVNGKAIEILEVPNLSTDSVPRTYTVITELPPELIDSVAVRFLNNDAPAGQDRDLIVYDVSVGSQTVSEPDETRHVQTHTQGGQTSAALVVGVSNLNDANAGSLATYRFHGASNTASINGVPVATLPPIGNDTLIGGLGDDLYYRDSLQDQIADEARITLAVGSDGALISTIEPVELGEFDIPIDHGYDKVLTTLDYLVLPEDIEAVQLIDGSAATTVIGNSRDNELIGNSLSNTLEGGLGSDHLDGRSGSDVLRGGAGGDTYVIDNANDVIDEIDASGNPDLDADIDTVYSSIDHSLASASGKDLDNLTLKGWAVTGIGNARNNVLIGNLASNRLEGGLGNDTLYGGDFGNDTLVGGEGDDTYVINIFEPSVPSRIRIDEATQGGGTDTVYLSRNLSYTLQAGLENVVVSALGDAFGNLNDFPDGSNSTYKIKGNDVANQLTGNVNRDSLSGLAGDDILDGGFGDDTLDGGSGNDRLLDGAGNDWLVGGSGNDTLVTIDGDDTLEGGADNDTLTISDEHWSGNIKLIGGDGDDTYEVNALGSVWDTTELIEELGSGGTDTVQSSVDFVLGAELENLTLVGELATQATGNALANTLIANDVGAWLFGLGGNDALEGGLGDDVLDGGQGNDTLQGSEGRDTLIGGLGDDTYHLIDSLDTTEESANAGSDTLIIGYAGADFSLAAWQDGLSQIENVTLSAIAGTGTLRGDERTASQLGNNVLIGNASANTLYGLSGDDTLNGGGGADTLHGGLGNDVYYIDNSTAQIIEVSNGGIDTILSARTSMDLTSFGLLENLSLLEDTGATSATGNGLGNKLIGNALANSLSGAGGNDTIEGGAGNDTVDGGAGNDVLWGGLGNDTLRDTVSYGNDTYRWGRNEGSDSVNDNRGTDSLQIGSTVAQQLWFTHEGTSLVIRQLGTSEKLVINSFYAYTTSTSKTRGAGSIESIALLNGQAGDARLSATGIDSLVSAMAGMSPPTAPISSGTLASTVSNTWTA